MKIYEKLLELSYRHDNEITLAIDDIKSLIKEVALEVIGSKNQRQKLTEILGEE